MHDLDKALGDITSIREQMARSTEFRGYGAATLAATGAFAILASVAQWIWVQSPSHQVYSYLGIWLGTAILSASLIAIQTWTRTHRMHSGMADEMLHMAIEQFLPSAAAGALLTLAIAHFVPASLWMLPGLWQILFSLGVFSSCRFLPRRMNVAGAWYLLAGLTCIALGGNRALSPFAMGVAFGGGQLLVAAILFYAAKQGADE
ncbi:MAG TPA: hypothetical protein VK716_09015 [Terracidiphilus sp.]|nr:hypothetical protein [Terracidiphilus sp.]